MQQSKKRHSTLAFIRIFCFSLFITACLQPDFTAHAESKEPEQAAELKIDNPKQTIYLSNNDIGTKEAAAPGYFLVQYNEDNNIRGKVVRSDNELVTGKIEVRSDEWCFEYEEYICIDPLYPGTANLLFEDWYGRIYTCTLEVLPYENPIKSLTITNVNDGKNLAGDLDKAYRSSKELVISKKTAAPKLKVVAAEDWKITSLFISAGTPKGKWYELEAKDINAQSKTMSLKKAAKGDRVNVWVYLKNSKNGEEIFVTCG